MRRSELPAVAIAILDALLDQHEQPGRERVVRVRINQKQHPTYFDATTAAPRRDTNSALQTLEREGLLRLHWLRFQEGNWLEKVDLVTEGVGALYRMLGRTPRSTQMDAFHALLDAQQPRSDWHAALLDDLRQRLALRKSLAPLDLNDMDLSRDLLTALSAIIELREPTLVRTLSVQIFSNSKRLEELAGGLTRLLRPHTPGAEEAEPWELLRLWQLERVPEYIPLAGPLMLRTQDATLDLAAFRPSLALPASLLSTLQDADCSAPQMLTVENLTTFSQLTLQRPPTLAALYTGGFPSPMLVHLISKLDPAPGTLYHWGDLDAGGLRILAYLRRQLGKVRPLAMDGATLATHRTYAQPLSSADRTALQTLRSNQLLADCRELIDALLDAGLKLEQEAVPVVWALDRMGRAVHE